MSGCWTGHISYTLIQEYLMFDFKTLKRSSTFRQRSCIITQDRALSANIVHFQPKLFTFQIVHFTISPFYLITFYLIFSSNSDYISLNSCTYLRIRHATMINFHTFKMSPQPSLYDNPVRRYLLVPDFCPNLGDHGARIPLCIGQVFRRA